MSTHYGPGGVYNMSTATKIGGLSQFSSNSSGYVVNDGIFSNLTFGNTMIQLYGSDTTSFADAGFVWSGGIDINILTPASNLTGSMYVG